MVSSHNIDTIPATLLINYKQNGIIIMIQSATSLFCIQAHNLVEASLQSSSLDDSIAMVLQLRL